MATIPAPPIPDSGDEPLRRGAVDILTVFPVGSVPILTQTVRPAPPAAGGGGGGAEDAGYGWATT